jgi:SOS-response transcriptional repressor LexA
MKKEDPTATNKFERSQPINKEFFEVPVLGSVIPDDPDFTTGKYELNELVNNYQKQGFNSFNFSILDDAMKNCGILKGDLLTVDFNIPLKDEDIAVFKIGEKILVRKYYRKNNLIRLETADDYPSHLVVEPNTPGFKILGKVVSVTREL